MGQLSDHHAATPALLPLALALLASRNVVLLVLVTTCLMLLHPLAIAALLPILALKDLGPRLLVRMGRALVLVANVLAVLAEAGPLLVVVRLCVVPLVKTALTNRGLPPTPPKALRVVLRRDLPPEHFPFRLVGIRLIMIRALKIGPRRLLIARLSRPNLTRNPPPRFYLTSPDPKPILPCDSPLRPRQGPTTCLLTKNP